MLKGERDLFNLSPQNATYSAPLIPLEFTPTDIRYQSFIRMPNHEYILDYDLSGNMKWYTAILNHAWRNWQEDIAGQPYNMLWWGHRGGYNYQGQDYDQYSTGENYYGTDLTFEEIEDTYNENQYLYSGAYNGSTIHTYDKVTNLGYLMIKNRADVPQEQNVSFPVCAISTGIQYTMPKNPKMSLTMGIEIPGVDTVTTVNGSTLTNIKYTGSPLWANSGGITNPFEIWNHSYSDNIFIDTSDIPHNPNYDVREQGLIRHGRRTWDLSFSYISDVDLFPANYKSGYYSQHGFEGTMSEQYNASDIAPSSDEFTYNLDTDDSFVAQVWNKTLGGALSFIFQPSSENRDEFYICKFDQSSLSVKQSAHNVYDLSVRIEECW